ncbi:hypothetical protein B0H19DRAFT_1162634 [Mycena capillaripes]|nr:hypothetical protein B0H19DRAFT_1162634 [Mycena capillaripes]
MSGIELLVPDLLSEIMLRLPSTIEQKFTFSQVSRLWRDVALNSPLFWSSFTGRDDYPGASKADAYRLPLVLERSGLNTTLHVHFRFFRGDWPADALRALMPYVARIETLDVEFNEGVEVGLLFNSNLEFPALKTLRLEGPDWGKAPVLSLTAPRLDTLDIQRFYLTDCATILSPTVENIRLYRVFNVESLSNILERCPRVWRVVFDPSSYTRDRTEHDFEAFTRRPVAPALRELELRVGDSELGRMLKAAFPDVVLHTLTGSIYNGHGLDDLELLTGALLPGVGRLVGFELFDYQEIKLRDENRRIRILRCWKEDSNFEVQDVWRHLSIHHDLNETVREIRIHFGYLDDYVEIFGSYPPKLQDGITLGISTDWDPPTDDEGDSAQTTPGVDTPCDPPFPQVTANEGDNAQITLSIATDCDLPFQQVTDDEFEGDDEGDSAQTTRLMYIPGLAKVEVCGRGDDLSLERLYEVLARIQPPTARTVEVCIGIKKLRKGDKDTDPLVALQKELSGKGWVICSHCVR